ncbi:interleukin 17a/f1 [Scleropages formosus]|uniref:interleukin 17a/f1 n=1 Tax=Scleropages formosus TaxID=113540 RepID=UPI0010FA6B91|nr:interleukin-17F-like [Scleropages formosus]
MDELAVSDTEQLYSSKAFVFCMLAALAVLMGVDGLPRRNSGKSGTQHGKMGQELQTSSAVESVNLLLNISTTGTSVQVPELSNRSLSPWTYSTIHDESVFPSYMAEAKCLLTGCWNSAGEEVMDLESRPIYHQVLVLKRVHGDRGAYVYKLETKSIAVGCTCIRPVVIEHK